MKTIHLIILFVCSALLASCTENTPTSTNEVHFKGNTYQFNNIDSVCNNAFPTPGNVIVMYGTWLTTAPGNTSPSLAIICGYNQFMDTTATSENIQSFFTTGDWSIIDGTITNGVAIAFYEGPGGNIYSTDGNNNSSSSFHFTGFTYHSGSPSYVDYTCEFSCNLMNMNDATDIEPIDGSFSGRFNAEYH